MLQNRVTPTGELIATPHRGTMLGNRGVLHDEHRTIVRRAQVRRWITCVLEYKGRHRTVMTPRRYTELFFLDEAVSFAAGHRPCAQCRYADYQRFRQSWRAALNLDHRPGADEMDRVLHGERGLTNGARRTFDARLADLPDGVFLALPDGPVLWHGRRLLRWSPAGYGETSVTPTETVPVLTPPTTVAVFRAGYTPTVHPSALN